MFSIRREGRSITVPTRVAFFWLIGSAAIILVLMLIVATKVSWKFAFDTLVGEGATYHVGLGPMGVILALAGYLIVPAVIGAVVATLVAGSIDSRYDDQPLKKVVNEIGETVRALEKKGQEDSQTTQPAPGLPQSAADPS